MRHENIRPLIINQVPQSYSVYKFLVNLFNSQHVGNEAGEILDQASISSILDSSLTDKEIYHIMEQMNLYPGTFYYLLILPVLPFDSKDVEHALKIIGDELGKEILIKSDIHHDFEIEQISGYAEDKKLPNIMFCIVPSGVCSLANEDVNRLRSIARSLLNKGSLLQPINLIETVAYLKLLASTGRIPSKNSLEVTSTRYFNLSSKQIEGRFCVLELCVMSDGTLIMDNSSVYDGGGARFVFELWP